jgi:hypothetical protein
MVNMEKRKERKNPYRKHTTIREVNNDGSRKPVRGLKKKKHIV